MKILFLGKGGLFPADSGSRRRTVSILRQLAKWHEITYLCNTCTREANGEETDDARFQEIGIRTVIVPSVATAADRNRRYFDAAKSLASRFPYDVNHEYASELQQRAVELLSGDRFDLVICNYVQMARVAAGLHGVPKLLLQHNVEADMVRQRAIEADSWLRRRFFAIEWRKMAAFESRAGRRFDAVVTESQHNRQRFQELYGWNHVLTIDTAVDVDYVRPKVTDGAEDRVVFLGAMDSRANEDGVAFFLEQVWPKVLASVPDARFEIVGRNGRSPGTSFGVHRNVDVVGNVSDVRPYLARAAVVVMPVLIAGETRTRIFEAMASGRPIVSTSLGSAGLSAEDGKHLLIANWSQAFADAVVKLLGSPRLRRELGQSARELVVSRFRAEVVASDFERICKEVVESCQAKTA